MLEHNLDTAHGILHLRPKGALEKEDFAKLARTVDPFIESKGELAGIIVDAPGFPGWDSLGAMAAHFRFVRDHHKRVKKIAIVTDAPMGGCKESGFGQRHGAEGIRRFCQQKTVVSDRFGLKEEFPWYPASEKKARQIRHLLMLLGHSGWKHELRALQGLMRS